MSDISHDLTTRKTPTASLQISIRNLVDSPSIATTIGEWFKAEWSQWPQHQSVEKTVEKLHGRLHVDKAPLTLIAFDRETPIGTASLILCEMTTHPELPFWLGDLYVVPDKRRLGIGTALIEAVVGKARELGADRVFLYTEDQEALYKKRGWVTIERALYDGYEVAVMERKV